MRTRNTLKLTHRLSVVLSLVQGGTLSDIGCDHAYLSIAACLTGVAEKVIACDIKPGPLSKADQNIHAYGLTHKIETRLGDGLSPVKPYEADCIVIAGMGGMRIVEILTNGLEVARSAKQLVLQPQHDVIRLRKWLHSAGFALYDEQMAQEDGRFYPILAARPATLTEISTMPWTEVEYILGKSLIAHGGPVWYAYLGRETEKLTEYINAIKSNGSLDNEAYASLNPLQALLKLYEEQLEAYKL